MNAPANLNMGRSSEIGQADSDVILKFDRVSRHFGLVKAVNDISLELRRGEVLTLLGPSGCGKTTTLRMAIGLERATMGTITYAGRVMDRPDQKQFVPPEKREMGMVFQSYAIWPHLNVFENVAFPLRSRRVKNSEIEKSVAEALELVGLPHLAKRPSTALSGGQQQRVAVARGLVGQPDVLLMDEPFSNLDAKLRDQVRADLKVLQRRLGISTLFVTHDQSEALALSDRIAVMKDGQVEQIGAPEDIYNRPATPFVRDFIGQSIHMAGRVAAVDNGRPVKVALGNGEIIEVAGENHLVSPREGDPCQVTIRPEDIAGYRADHASRDSMANGVSATIRTLLFLGRDYEAIVEMPRGHMATVLLPRAGEWAEGQSILLSMPPKHVQIWPREGGEG